LGSQLGRSTVKEQADGRSWTGNDKQPQGRADGNQEVRQQDLWSFERFMENLQSDVDHDTCGVSVVGGWFMQPHLALAD